MRKPLLSVLMTSYNREKYIGQAIRSILKSTFTDFELIITDDRSTDNTIAIARSFEEKDSRVRVYSNAENLGDYPNRNKAASFAEGKYLKYVDADDYIYPWGLELLVRMMEEFPQAGWGLCSLEQNIANPFPFLLSPLEAYRYHYFGPGLFHKAPLSAIIKKEVFDAEDGFSGKRMIGDFEMWHKLAQRYPVVAMPHGIVWYRKHEEQEMTHYHKFEGAYDAVRQYYLTSEQCPLLKSERETLLRLLKNSIKAQVWSNLIRLRFGRFKTSVQRYKQMR